MLGEGQGKRKTAYAKCLKISNTLFHTFCAYFFFLFMQLFLNILSGMVNRVDPDQTASLEAV